VLARRDAVYCGLIGSKSKRARFERQLRADGLGEELHKLTCPIGGAIGLKGKEPAVIAAATVAEMLLVLEARQAQAAENAHAE
jgi:xanthine dehydrogenase accessory factor